MSKRFADTDKYKKSFIRNMPGPYKLLWDYVCLNCDFIGIWQVDFEVAQIYIGRDSPVNRELAIGYFNDGEERIKELDNGKKWLILSFVPFQYGVIQEDSRSPMHKSVISELKKSGLWDLVFSPIHTPSIPLIYPYLGDKVKVKVKVKEEVSSSPSSSLGFMEFWAMYPKKVGKDCALKSWNTKKPPIDKCLFTLGWQIKSADWLKENGKYIPMPATWLNQGRWNDEPVQMKTTGAGPVPGKYEGMGEKV